MSALSAEHFDDLVHRLSQYYGETSVRNAIRALKHWYKEQAFDNEDITNDWIPNDFQNCDGIDIFVDQLNYSQKVNNPQNKRILFDWFCHWLLDNVPKPRLYPSYAIVTPSYNNTHTPHIENTPIQNVAALLKEKMCSHVHISTSDANNIADCLENICKNEEYIDIQQLQSDLENIDDSYIMDEIISIYPHYTQYKEKIFQILQSIVFDRYTYMPFDLKSPDFKYQDTEQMCKAAETLCLKYIPTIFTGAPNDLIDFDKMDTDDAFMETQCFHAKAIDLENRFPLLISMLDVFTRYCCEENDKHWKIYGLAMKPNVKNKDYFQHFSVDITAGEWLTQCRFGKYFKAKSDITAYRYGGAMQSMLKRLMPRIDLNHLLGDTVFDSLDIFARYAIAMNNFLFKLNARPEAVKEWQYLPMHIDVWIIPRLSKRAQHHDMQIRGDLYDVSFSSILKTNDGTEEKQPLQLSNIHDDSHINCLGKGLQFDTSSIPGTMWNLEDDLNTSGYIKDEDYFVLCTDNISSTDMFDVQRLEKNIGRLWNQNSAWRSERYNRYIIIVDRRNPKHIERKEMMDDTHKDQIWNDKLYLIKPKEYNKICKEFEYKLNECFVANTKAFIFPFRNAQSHIAENLKALGGLESGNGYKWLLSYHIHFRNKVKVYWGYGHGVQRFLLDDIKWLWPRYFKLIDNRTQFQYLSKETLRELEISLHKYKLNDDQFDDFHQQIKCFS